jgi:hypothetical protein
VLSSDLPGVNPATLNEMILYYRLMTKWSGLGDSTELSRVGLSQCSLCLSPHSIGKLERHGYHRPPTTRVSPVPDRRARPVNGRVHQTGRNRSGCRGNRWNRTGPVPVPVGLIPLGFKILNLNSKKMKKKSQNILKNT